MVTAFVDDHRGKHGVEPICETLPIAPSIYYRHDALQADPSLRSARARRDEALMPEVIRRRGPWRSLEDVEFATLEGVSWFDYHRLLGPIGHVPPVEYEEAYDRAQEAPAEPLRLKSAGLR